MLELGYTSQFKKDYKKVQKSGRVISQILKEVIEILQHEKPLPRFYSDHKLLGNYKNRRELHLKPDLLLIYKIDKENIILERIGSHSDLFE